MSMDDVLTLEELAAYLKVSETTAYSLVRSGDIPGRKVGREWRFLRERVVNWLMQAGTEDDMEKTGMLQRMVQRDEWGGEFKIEEGQQYRVGSVEFQSSIATLDGIQPTALKDLNEVMSRVLAGGDRLKKASMGGAKTAAEIINMMGSAVETSARSPIFAPSERSHTGVARPA